MKSPESFTCHQTGSKTFKNEGNNTRKHNKQPAEKVPCKTCFVTFHPKTWTKYCYKNTNDRSSNIESRVEYTSSTLQQKQHPNTWQQTRTSCQAAPWIQCTGPFSYEFLMDAGQRCHAMSFAGWNKVETWNSVSRIFRWSCRFPRNNKYCWEVRCDGLRQKSIMKLILDFLLIFFDVRVCWSLHASPRSV